MSSVHKVTMYCCGHGDDSWSVWPWRQSPSAQVALVEVVVWL